MRVAKRSRTRTVVSMRAKETCPPSAIAPATTSIGPVSARGPSPSCVWSDTRYVPGSKGPSSMTIAGSDEPDAICSHFPSR